MTVPHSGDLLPLTNHNCVRPAFHAGFFSHNSVQTESEWSSPCPALPVYADGQTGSARKEWLVADLRQVVFRQAGHFHNGIAVNAVMQHGTGNFQSGLTLTF